MGRFVTFRDRDVGAEIRDAEASPFRSALLAGADGCGADCASRNARDRGGIKSERGVP